MIDGMRIGTRLWLGFSATILLTTSITLLAVYQLWMVTSNSEGASTAGVSNLPWLLLACTGGASAIAALIVGLLVRSIVRPLKAGGEVITAVAEGNLNKDLESGGEDEISKLLSGVQHMVTKLRSVIAGVKISADNVAGGGRQLSDTSIGMGENAKRLSTQIEQVVASVHEVSRTIQDVAENAARAAEASRRASDTAVVGKRKVDTTSEDMVLIARTIGQAAQTIEELGSSSAQIGEIVAEIKDIADQTNLLALNAAIEAARAGEQGRGFAVVADEVRKLAERTSQATRVIAERVCSIQNAAVESVSAIKRGTLEVEKGVGLAKEASVSLESIVEVSNLAMEMVARIATATEQQSSAADEVSRNMENISQITRDAASDVKQIGVASTDLLQLTVGLKELISFFKGTTVEAESLVKKAIDCVRAIGRENAFAKFNDPTGEFVNRDLYIFVFDTHGYCHAHGADKTKVSKNHLDVMVQGRPIVRERVEIARTKGKGWQYFRIKNPATGKLEDKAIYIEGYEDLVIGSGAYR